MKKKIDAYQSWLDNKGITLDYLEYKASTDIPDEIVKAEPDFVAAPEPKQPEELQAAIEAIQDGALKELSATQQQIFQLYVVEGLREKEIVKALGIDKRAFRYHLKDIGMKLRRATLKKLRGV